MGLLALTGLVIAIWALARSGRVSRELEDLRKNSGQFLGMQKRLDALTHELNQLKAGKAEPKAIAPPPEPLPVAEKVSPAVREMPAPPEIPPPPVVPPASPVPPRDTPEVLVPADGPVELVPCPTCKQSIPVGRLYCFHCGATFGRPSGTPEEGGPPLKPSPTPAEPPKPPPPVSRPTPAPPKPPPPPPPVSRPTPAPPKAPPPPPPVSRPSPPPPPSALQQGISALRRVSWSDIEDKLGTNWLNKIGISALVIGFAIFLNYQRAEWGAVGNIALGYVLAAALLGLGAYGERLERYKGIARVILGGGWAVAYFTTFAMHNIEIEGVRVVESAGWGFFWLFLVAAGMVAHSLKYDSQVVTGFAYMLAYASVAITALTTLTTVIMPEALVAQALLTTSLVVILWRRSWYLLEPWAVLATYGLHWIWIWQVFNVGGGPRVYREDYYGLSIALLVAYWTIFTVSFFLRKEDLPDARVPLVVAFLTNAGLLLAVLGYQSQDSNMRFWVLLGLGVIYLALAVFSRQVQRRLGFLLTSTLGAGFVFISIPVKYAGAPLEYIWLIEAEVLLFLGWRLADAHLRRLGWVAAGVLAPYIFYQHLLTPLMAASPFEPSARLGLMLLGLGGAYVINAVMAPRLLGKKSTALDDVATTVSSPVGVAVLLVAAWFAFPAMWVAPVWALLVLVVAEAGPRLKDEVLRWCGHATVALVLARLVAVNLIDPSLLWQGGPASRVVTIALAVGLLFLAAWRVREALLADGAAATSEVQEAFGGPGLAVFYAASGAMVAAAMIAKEYLEYSTPAAGLVWTVLGLAAVAAVISYPIATGFLLTSVWAAMMPDYALWVAAAWLLLAFAIYEIGVRFDKRVLRACAHATVFLTAVRLGVVNLILAPAPFAESPRLLTMAVCVALVYLYVRRTRSTAVVHGKQTEWERALVTWGLPGYFTWPATLLGAAVIIIEVSRSDAPYLFPALALGALAMAVVAAIVSYPIATGFLLTSVWLALLPGFSTWPAPAWDGAAWVAPAWIVLAFALHYLGQRRDDRVLCACGHGAIVLAAGRLVVVNLPDGLISLRLLTVALSGVLFYLYARRTRQLDSAGGREENEWLRAFGGSGWASGVVLAATGITGTMLWLELNARVPEFSLLALGALALALAAAIVSFPVAVGFLLTSVWLTLLPSDVIWVAPAWMAVAFVIHEAGHRWRNRILEITAHGAVLLAVVRLVLVNFPYASPVSDPNLRLLTVAAPVMLLYLYARRIHEGTVAATVEAWKLQLSSVITWAATSLLATLIWYEATTAAIALAWGLLGLALFEVGRVRSDTPLLLQGYGLFALSFGRIFIADLNAFPQVLEGYSARLITVLLLAFIYYYAAAVSPKTFRAYRNGLLWIAMVALAALARFELAPNWVIVAWGALAVALYLAAGRLTLDTFRYQTYAMVLLIATRAGLDNWFQTGGMWNDITNVRTVTIVTACMFLYLLLVLAKFGPDWLRASAEAAREAGSTARWKVVRAFHWLDGRPQHLFFFVPTILLTVLMSIEMQTGDRANYLTASWGLEGVVLFIIAVGLRERVYRWYALLLLLMCIGKIVSVDVWELETFGKIVSLMGLGAALLLVSFLYTRYREAWRKYL